jgi:hypothetical protein
MLIRKKLSKRNAQQTGRRDNLSISTSSLVPLQTDYSRSINVFQETPLVEVEDRRKFHFDEYQAVSVSKPRHRLKVSKPRQPSKNQDRFAHLRTGQTKGLIAFQNPSKVAICIRRKQRKQVLHAIGKAGKVGQRRPKRNYFSSIHC